MSASQESITSSNNNNPPAQHARLFGQNQYTVEQMEWALRRNSGLILPAARTLQCSSRTIHSYLERYPQLERVRQESRRQITNFAETKLIEKVKNGDNWAVSLWLKTQAGYTEKQKMELTGADGGPVQVQDATDRRHEIVAGMVRGHLQSGYSLADALRNIVLLGIPKESLSLLKKEDLVLQADSSGTYMFLPEEVRGNGR